MKIVVDTNIIFSCVVRSSGTIGELLLRDPGPVQFFAPALVKEELLRHRVKLRKVSKLTAEQLNASSAAILQRIKLISEPAVSFAHRRLAMSFVSDVDEFDAPFVALALELDGLLWTGDLALVRGLRRKGFNQVVTTTELELIRARS